MDKKLNIAIPENEERFQNYANALRHLDANPIFINEEFNVNDFDGLLVPGGVDVNPKLYHQENNGSEDINDELDHMQMIVLDKFVKAKKPILGICRGHQIINVYFNGTLIQDLENANEHKRVQEGVDNINTVEVDDDSFLYEIYKNKSIITNSSHHQAVDKLGDGLKVCARCKDVIEALYHTSLPIYTVQFHPERMCFEKSNPDTVDGSLIIKYFLEQCTK